jgi:hypothetical protein
MMVLGTVVPYLVFSLAKAGGRLFVSNNASK